MEQQSRSSSRVFSSLRDLKLKSGQLTKAVQTGRRPSKKNAIMGDTFEDDKFYETFTKIDRKQTPKDIEFLLQGLSKHFIFSQLVNDKLLLEDVLRKFFFCQVEKGQYIIKQNDDASSFFVLETGKLSVIINGQTRRQILPGQGFGQLALLYSAPRSASLLAVEDCTLWGIDRITFRKAVSEVCERQAKENRNFIQRVKFFEYLTPKQRDSVAGVLIQQTYHKGDKIVIQGDPASSFYIIKSGTVRILINGQQTNKLTVGGYFGEAALISTSQLRNATVEADDECIVLALGRQSIRTILGLGINTIVFRNKIARCMSNSKYFSQLDSLSIERIIDCLQIIKIPKGKEVVTAGSLCRDKMFFVLEGSLEKSLLNTEIDIEDTDYMHGQRAILSKYSTDRYEKTQVFSEDGAIAYADYATIFKVMTVSFEQLVERHKSMSICLTQHEEELAKIKQSSKELKLQDLKLLCELGAGQFGVVYLTRHNNSYYALKCVQKTQIVQCKLEKQLMQQREVLNKSNHPFLLQYCRSFKDEQYVYFLTQFLNGMEMFHVIRIMKSVFMSSQDTQFYIGSMILALEYLHHSGIIYRDLKPENMIVDAEGYLKLIDMGTCKLMHEKPVGSRTFTIIGTPQYMAPEVLAGKGYSYSCDLWSLGVCMYEFMCGQVPFGEDVEDPYEIYQQVMKKQLEFPKKVTDQAAKSLMQQLLAKQQESRFCGSFTSIKNHPWLVDLQWDMLLCKKLTPPFMIPKDKLINAGSLDSTKGKTIKQQFARAQKSSGNLKKNNRKDLDPNWDCTF